MPLQFKHLPHLNCLVAVENQNERKKKTTHLTPVIIRRQLYENRKPRRQSKRRSLSSLRPIWHRGWAASLSSAPIKTHLHQFSPSFPPRRRSAEASAFEVFICGPKNVHSPEWRKCNQIKKEKHRNFFFYADIKLLFTCTTSPVCTLIIKPTFFFTSTLTLLDIRYPLEVMPVCLH